MKISCLRNLAKSGLTDYWIDKKFVKDWQKICIKYIVYVWQFSFFKLLNMKFRNIEFWDEVILFRVGTATVYLIKNLYQ